MISIIIPAHNEENRIGKTLNNYISHFSNSNFNYEIIVEMDGCTDNTLEIVKKFSEKYPQVKYICFQKKLGKGGGFLEGFKVAKGDLIAITDADSAIKPRYLEELIKLVEKNWDCAIASRYLKASKILVKQDLARRIASRGFNLLIRLFFNLKLKDTQCGGKVFKSEVIKNVMNKLNIKGFAFDVDLLWRIKQKGYTIKEVPITWEHKDESKIFLPKVVPEMFFALIKLRLRK